jgi:hypothetical protein
MAERVDEQHTGLTDWVKASTAEWHQWKEND